MQIQIARISFPEIELHQHYGHKLRGYFGNLFMEKSPLLHNHYDDGKLRYKYPLVQYKVIDKTPMLVGLAEGAELLLELFTQIKTLELGDLKLNVYSKNIKSELFEPRILEEGNFRYSFKSLWMALNQQNYKKFFSVSPGPEQLMLLSRILTGNILSFYKSIGYTAERNIQNLPLVEPKSTMFKNKKMTAFAGIFYCNAFLPSYIGIGKSVSRGFGTVFNYDEKLK
jgi:hypothetical protein